MKYDRKFAIVTFFGVLAGSFVWLLAYLHYRTAAIGYDGPAGLLLGLSMVIAGVVFAFVWMVFWLKKQKRSKKDTLRVLGASFLVGGLSCLVVGASMNQYMISNYSYSNINKGKQLCAGTLC